MLPWYSQLSGRPQTRGDLIAAVGHHRTITAAGNGVRLATASIGSLIEPTLLSIRTLMAAPCAQHGDIFRHPELANMLRQGWGRREGKATDYAAVKRLRWCTSRLA